MAKRILSHFQDKLSPLLCGFRSKHSTQHALFRLIQKWQSCLDKSGKIGTILMDLSKAFDTLPHDLLLAKLAAYGLSENSLRLIFSYLSGRYQRIKIGSTYSEWLLTILGVPQGSILGPLLFNIFINDLLLIVKNIDICNFADDNTIYCCDNSLDTVINSLELGMRSCLNWFHNNQMVANPGKFQLMFLGINNDISLGLRIRNIDIKPQRYVKLLGVEIDSKLRFDSHIKSICSAASRKINCLQRIRNYIDIKQASLLGNAFIMSSFNNCPLIWMFCNKTSGQLMDRMQKRCLRIIFDQYDFSLPRLLEISGTSSIHIRHIQFLLVEVYKSLHHLNPFFMQYYFQRKSVTYVLRNSQLLVLPPTSTITYGVNAIHFQACLLWNRIPHSAKTATS